MRSISRISKTIEVLIIVLFVTIGVLFSHNVKAATSGFQCLAYDESALSQGDLIRTTFGILNKSKKTISVYCPVEKNTDVYGIMINYNIVDPSRTIDVYTVENLQCWLAYGYIGSSYKQFGEDSRRYIKFKKGGRAQTLVYPPSDIFDPSRSTVVNVKCNLKPKQQIIGISTF